MPTSKGRGSAKRRKGPTPRKRRVEAPTTQGDGPRRTSGPVTDNEKQKEPAPVASSARYTPPRKNRGMFRPTWHKVVGAFLIVLGITIFVLNDAEWFGVHLMPGGHNELWAVTGIAVVATSTWWFGWFDRSTTRW